MNALKIKLNTQKQQLLYEINNLQMEEDNLRNKKLEYVDLFTEEVITKEELVEYRTLTD